MEDKIIEVDNVADPDSTFTRFDLTNRLPIWKLLSTQEKGKLKEAYEKGGDSAQVWTGPHVSNSVSFNDIRAIVKGLTLRGNVIDAYAEMLMYEQQTKAPKSADDEKSYISTLCLEKRIVNVNIFSYTKPAGRNILSNIFCRWTLFTLGLSIENPNFGFDDFREDDGLPNNRHNGFVSNQKTVEIEEIVSENGVFPVDLESSENWTMVPGR
ncbi:RING-H2 finger protein ATL46 [Camellia lanceoleosa]|uniref:RING-H2 finger protein ATL46 n=1 Tax=Camellia lanceoleosa TaxID=1840588 RepID=A0ACC0I576_9ERIC|nr:RING-H2 finger protein ATL46 [Camellia lanceoleosa]